MLNNYISIIKESAIQSGISDPTQLHEIVILSLYKLLQSPALYPKFKQYELEYSELSSQTFHLTEDNVFGDKYRLDDTQLKEMDTSFSSDSFCIKKDQLKVTETKMISILSESLSFVDFLKNIKKSMDICELEDLRMNSSMVNTLLNAVKLHDDIVKGDIFSVDINVAPFAYIIAAHGNQHLREFLTKTIKDKLNYFEVNDNFFNKCSDIDGLRFTNFKKFVDAYSDNSLDKESFISKLLISNDPKECIEAVFSGHWFESHKIHTLKTLKRALTEPTLDSLYAEYPSINSILSDLYEKYPVFNIDQNDLITIKTTLETKETPNEDKELNKSVYMQDLTRFAFDRERTIKKSHESEDGNILRVYAKSPFGILMNIKGTIRENGHITICYNDRLEFDNIISDENKDLVIQKLGNVLKDNQLIFAYESDALDERIVKEIEKLKGQVILIDRAKLEQDVLNIYQVMINKMKLSYSEILHLEKMIPTIENNLDKDQIETILTKELNSFSKKNKKNNSPS